MSADHFDLIDEIERNLRRARAIVNAHAAACLCDALGEMSDDDHADLAATVDDMLGRAQELAHELYRRCRGK
jgi:hypothetical protein